MSRAENPLHRPDRRHERLKRERKRTPPKADKTGGSKSGAIGNGAGRVGWVALAFSLGLLGLGARLYNLQVTQHSQYAVQSASNFQRDEVIRALRGEIRTRDGLLLATNRLAVDLVYTGRRASVRGEAIPAWDKIVYLAGIKPDALKDGNPREPDFKKETETVLARNVSQDRLAALYEYTVLIPSLGELDHMREVYKIRAEREATGEP